MVQLRTQRTALVLYGVLLVLPTLVLGGLQWNQIVQDKIDELAAVPREADDAVRRLRDSVWLRLDQLVRGEEERPFQVYGQFYYPPSADSTAEGLPPTPVFSPLRDAHRPTGLVCWFAFDLSKALRREEPRIDLFWGDGRDDELGDGGRTLAASKELIEDNVEVGQLRRAIRLGDYEERIYPLRDVAANRAEPEDQDCFVAQDELMRQPVELTTSRFHVQAFRGPNGELRVAATRRVLMDPDERLRGLNPCLDRLSRGVGLMQGFYIDPAWLFGELPRTVAANVLDSSQRFVGPGEAYDEGDLEVHVEPLSLFDALGLEVREPVPEGLATVRIAVDTAGIEARFRARMWRFFGVAAMLAISLSTGMVLLLRSVSADLRQAQRAENFVASVTHELRTPLASIKLHGEMLLDGWASDPDKQREYYRRIVRETERLSTMVERVLEKARLSAGAARPHPGDLNRLIGALEEQLVEAGEGRADLEFDLAPDLSQVMLTPEAVTSILVNLVENARKYAPYDPTRQGSEPIRVATRPTAEGVRLQVLDRGPGIPAGERARIFDAFYRVGNEATRTSRGTGLGLHLVRLQAESIGARVRVEGRPGGGAAFRVDFQPADADA